jgi:hypothetical protein
MVAGIEHCHSAPETLDGLIGAAERFRVEQAPGLAPGSPGKLCIQESFDIGCAITCCN